MLIRGNNGAAVDLRPLRWQFPADAGAWDDRWLVISGTIDLGDRSWSFTDPCLLIEEAHAVSRWLRDAAHGRIEPQQPAPGGEPEPSLSFMEPPLGLSIVTRHNGELVVRVHLSAESAPPWLRRDEPHQARQTVDLRLQADQLLRAATAWAQELDALPARSFADTG